MNRNKNLDQVTIMLFVGIFLGLTIIMMTEHFFPKDGEVFQVIAGVVSSFSGALFTKLKMESTNYKDVAGDDNSTKIVNPPATVEEKK